MELLTQFSGWTGAILILLAYYLLSTKRMSDDSMQYHAINLIGGLGIASNSLIQKAWPSVFINVIWSIIALIALLKIKKT